MSKVYIRKACGRGRTGQGYIIMDGRMTVDEVVTDWAQNDEVIKLHLASASRDDFKADKRAAGGYNLITAAVIAADYAKRHGKDVTPFVERAARAGRPLVDELDAAVKRLREARGKVSALVNAAILLGVDMSSGYIETAARMARETADRAAKVADKKKTPESAEVAKEAAGRAVIAENAAAEISAAEKAAEKAAETVKLARKRINKKSADVEGIFFSFRSMGADYHERPGEELKAPAEKPAESAE